MNCLKAQHITQQFGSKKVLNNVSICLQTGDVIGLFGRNGSGKSTLLKILFGVLKNTGFSLDIDGNRILQKQIVPLKKIGYLPQDSFLPKRITVRNLIPMIFPDGKLQELLFYRKGIAKFEKQRIGELSIGQRKYLELLLLSHMEHPFLLLDEPFSMVEPLYKEEIKGLLEEIKLFKGMIITDHYYHDVFEVSSQNYVLKEGSLTAVFSEEDLKKYNYLRSD
ncbi:MAG: ABC transporter ATP-binding protein [Flavobacteriaceae bacterium]|nr:ABC transporter ATP-binding protein [Flavobacteriaceae bacterium]